MRGQGSGPHSPARVESACPRGRGCFRGAVYTAGMVPLLLMGAVSAAVSIRMAA
ncbi:hypothetical protein HMPREF3293_01287 [Christensenella minuta]|uniref:Uncharacterized protein n=1 Tax=Christensenella minuta TaxID=626937 RepID=A0A136Q5C2_9FIRM|nr:hypothetical protein HMPREF3293_01287 [Christensenella minuta]